MMILMKLLRCIITPLLRLLGFLGFLYRKLLYRKLLWQKLLQNIITSFIQAFSSSFILLLILIFTPHPHPNHILRITKKMSHHDQVLAFSEIGYSAQILFWILHLQKIRHGEYFIPQNASCIEVAKIIWSGKQVMKKICFPEGMSIAQIWGVLAKSSDLSGEMPDIMNNPSMLDEMNSPRVKNNGQTEDKMPDEGSMIAGTYCFTSGTPRKTLIKLITDRTQAVYDKMWEQNAFWTNQSSEQNRFWTNRKDWITFASLLEKEGYDYEDKAQISGVIANRLRRGMRLQIDATLLYVRTKGMYDQKLTWAELRNHKNDPDYNSPYNTYLHKGLPPGPITNPSEESLEIALNPRVNPYLYYRLVNGKHVFSTNFEAHKAFGTSKKLIR